MERVLLLVAPLALALSACFPSAGPGPTVQKPDSALSCAEVRTGIARAQSARDEAGRHKGLMDIQNIAWAVDFVPGFQDKGYTDEGVQQAADERIGKLNQLYAVKRCG